MSLKILLIIILILLLKKNKNLLIKKVILPDQNMNPADQKNNDVADQIFSS
jgi:hypothetical protein